MHENINRRLAPVARPADLIYQSEPCVSRGVKRGIEKAPLKYVVRLEIGDLMSENQVQDGAASASRPKHAPGEAYQDRVEHTIALLRRENAELRQEVITLKEAVASRDAFLAVAAHELRNPMTPIVGRVQRMRAMMKRPGVTLEKLDEALVLIEWLIERYVKRATTLLDVSRINSGKMRLADEPVEICQLIRDIAASVAPLAEHAG